MVMFGAVPKGITRIWAIWNSTRVSHGAILTQNPEIVKSYGGCGVDGDTPYLVGEQTAELFPV